MGRVRSNDRGSGNNYTCATSTSTSKNGLCSDLTNNVFDYGHKAAANHMRTTMEKYYNMSVKITDKISVMSYRIKLL